MIQVEPYKVLLTFDDWDAQYDEWIMDTEMRNRLRLPSTAKKTVATKRVSIDNVTARDSSPGNFVKVTRAGVRIEAGTLVYARDSQKEWHKARIVLVKSDCCEVRFSKSTFLNELIPAADYEDRLQVRASKKRKKEVSITDSKNNKARRSRSRIEPDMELNLDNNASALITDDDRLAMEAEGTADPEAEHEGTLSTTTPPQDEENDNSTTRLQTRKQLW